MKSKSFQAEKVIILFYFVINLSTFIMVTSTNTYIGDPGGSQFNLPLDISIILLFFNFAIYWGVYKLYCVCASHVQFDNESAVRKIEIILFFGISIAVIGFIWIDYGRAEYQSSSPFGFVFRLIPYSVFLLLYVSIVPRLNMKSTLLVLYYVVVKIAMGWSGFLLALFWVLFIRVYNSKRRSFSFFMLSVVFLTIIYFSAPFIYYLKYYVRYGAEFSFNYPFLLSKLTARLSTIQNILYIYENSPQFSAAYLKHLSDGFYFFEPFLSILPRSLLGIGTENLETIYVNIVTGVFNPGVIFYLSFAGKLISYTSTGIYDVVNFSIVICFLLLLLFSILRLGFNSAANPFLFYVLVQFTLSGSVEELSYTIYGVCIAYIVSRLSFRRMS